LDLGTEKTPRPRRGHMLGFPRGGFLHW
jgi:hypothetical protein